MTPQEKLIELREKFLFVLLAANACETYESTKQCVNIAVEEKLNNKEDKTFWQQVKEENK